MGRVPLLRSDEPGVVLEHPHLLPTHESPSAQRHAEVIVTIQCSSLANKGSVRATRRRTAA